MGQYKVPQNVEAEDKILGSLSLKQFIYALIGLGYGFLTFAIFREFPILFIIIGLPPTLLFLAVGLYQRQDQPFETYIAAVLSYLGKSRHRYWEKEPIAEVFHVDPPPPKPEEIHRDPREVRGQLNRLADIVDTRGWSAKQPQFQETEEIPVVDLLDRLGGMPEVQQLESDSVVGQEVTAADDILDVANSPGAAGLNELIENTVKNIREEALQKMQEQALKPPTTPSSPPQPIKVPAPPTSTVAAATIASAVVAPQTSPAQSEVSLTGMPSGDILNLSSEGGDLSVAQLAAQAQRQQNQLTEGQAVSLRPANS